jgi:hypothetical protein
MKLGPNYMYKINFLSILILAAVACNTNDNNGKDISSSSDVVLQWGTSKYLLSHCTATLENKDVRLFFETHPDSLGEYELEVLRRGNSLVSELRQATMPTDCSYVAAQFKILKQSIEFNKENYKKGDNLEGFLDLLLLGQKAYFRDSGEVNLRQNYDTVLLFGSVKAKVQ